MSYNLHCNVFEVRQTPSYITEMILSYDVMGDIDGGEPGVIRRYVAWCCYERQYRFSAAVNDPDEQSWIELDWDNHIREFRAALDEANEKGKDIVFNSI